MHSIGEIIFLNLGKGLQERVIIDPQWFCTSIIGKLSEPSAWISEELRVKGNGLVSSDALKTKLGLQNVASKAAAALSEDGSELVLTALQQLLLCDKVSDPHDHYIVPVLLRSKDNAGLEEWGPCAAFKHVVGRSLECTNSFDAFSAGFFPKLQVLLPKLKGCEQACFMQGAIILVISGCDCLVTMSPTQQSELMCGL